MKRGMFNLETVDLRKVHSISIVRVDEDNLGKKRVLIKFSLGEDSYKMWIFEKEYGWLPRYIYHSLKKCSVCKTNGGRCSKLEHCMDELFQIIMSSIRLQLLFI